MDEFQIHSSQMSFQTFSFSNLFIQNRYLNLNDQSKSKQIVIINIDSFTVVQMTFGYWHVKWSTHDSFISKEKNGPLNKRGLAVEFYILLMFQSETYKLLDLLIVDAKKLILAKILSSKSSLFLLLLEIAFCFQVGFCTQGRDGAFPLIAL